MVTVTAVTVHSDKATGMTGANYAEDMADFWEQIISATVTTASWGNGSAFFIIRKWDSFKINNQPVANSNTISYCLCSNTATAPIQQVAVALRIWLKFKTMEAIINWQRQPTNRYMHIMQVAMLCHEKIK